MQCVAISISAYYHLDIAQQEEIYIEFVLSMVIEINALIYIIIRLHRFRRKWILNLEHPFPALSPGHSNYPFQLVYIYILKVVTTVKISVA